MKNAIVFTSIIFALSLNATAEIIGSKFEAYQQNIIKAVVKQSCGIKSELVQLSHTERVQQIDQGIKDVYMTTVFEGKLRIDQGVFDVFLVKVNTVLADGYDHENKVWGLFSVENVICEQN